MNGSSSKEENLSNDGAFGIISLNSLCCGVMLNLLSILGDSSSPLVCFLEQRQYLFWGPNSLPNLLFRLLRKSSNVLPGVVVAAVFILDLSSDKFVNELDISRDRVDSFVKCAASLFRNVLSFTGGIWEI